ncbi:hypothetical protein AK812_SmicGene20357 [Symbiodinium microadriaticum]|uniref:Uncharacterized protein n=1 Tax=Symbiodinium microadriaticum TaxID=2951 RepID=A0A1Q9DQ93_SYMMI|nr:hypothetical protein AK812_SmicGene20357 [Symbiodinium microadriaticum]
MVMVTWRLLMLMVMLAMKMPKMATRHVMMVTVEDILLMGQGMVLLLMMNEVRGCATGPLNMIRVYGVEANEKLNYARAVQDAIQKKSRDAI